MSTPLPSQWILQLGYLCFSPGTQPFVPNGLRRTFPYPHFHFIFALQIPLAHANPQSPSLQYDPWPNVHFLVGWCIKNTFDPSPLLLYRLAERSWTSSSTPHCLFFTCKAQRLLFLALWVFALAWKVEQISWYRTFMTGKAVLISPYCSKEIVAKNNVLNNLTHLAKYQWTSSCARHGGEFWPA